MKTNTILIIIATLIVAAGAYWYFFGNGGDEAPLTTTSEVSNQKQAEFENLLSQLPIKFDTSMFSDERFGVLVDITTEIADEPFGKTDPFAPASLNANK